MLLYFGSLTILHASEAFVCDLAHTCSGGTHVRVRCAIFGEHGQPGGKEQHGSREREGQEVDPGCSPCFIGQRCATPRPDTVQGVATKQRIDTLLTERGLFPSRSRAAASVMAGEVCVGPGRRRACKPGEMIEVDALLDVREQPRYVSRGGIKLANALAAFGVDAPPRRALAVAGRRALDVGASTGGFTDCLLQARAPEVTAVDVAYGELDYGLRRDERVHVLERTNARTLTAEMLPYRPQTAVLDVSFISLVKVLPAVLGCMDVEYDVLALVKPQFEVGRERVGKGGVVRDADERRAALTAVGTAARAMGTAVLGFCSSGLPGPKGNLESFVWLAEPGRAGEAESDEQIAAMAAEVEP
jgi:23S rRNA (cytidine1920-2'-O)/16S rRNA (cytidine1409-2'-O)-methyltransferase